MRRAVERNDRFLVERNGEPAVLILSVADLSEPLIRITSFRRCADRLASRVVHL